MVSSPRYHVSLNEVRHGWSLVDLIDAHAVLDMFDELDRQARTGAAKPRKARAKKEE